MQEIKKDDIEKVGGGVTYTGIPSRLPLPGDPFPLPGPTPHPIPWPTFDEPLSDSTTI